MPYKDSYIWKIRQKIGHHLLIIPSADALAVRNDGTLLMVYNRDANDWFFPGGYVEEGQTSDECAARELLEEGGIDSRPEDMIPFAFCSGQKVLYPNGDETEPFTQIFYTDKWTDVGENDLDTDEVSARRWVQTDEIKSISRDKRILEIVDAYQSFLKSGKYKMINCKGDLYDFSSQN